MEQRTLRLGDILDDYCPRERRVTNHAVVAMIEENVKQTRCTTCDAEHAYKGGKAPRRKKKDAGVILYEEVLAGMPEATDGPIAPPPALAEVLAMPDSGDAVDQPAEPAAQPDREEPESPAEDGPFHRRLIRATLPRPEGQKDVRQVTDFTIRQSNGREGQGAYRGGGPRVRSFGNGSGNGNGHGNGHGNGQGNRPQGGRRFSGGAPGGSGVPGGRGARPAGGRPGFGSGNSQRHGGPSTGSGHGRPSTGSGHGRKRSR